MLSMVPQLGSKLKVPNKKKLVNNDDENANLDDDND